LPTIFRLDGLRVVIYPNDHSPEHVHVIGPGVEAVFELHCPDGPITLRESLGFSIRRLRELMASLEARLQDLCDAWEKIHGFD
jgi:Domain of unknown function (DUF4160)